MEKKNERDEFLVLCVKESWRMERWQGVIDVDMALIDEIQEV